MLSHREEKAISRWWAVEGSILDWWWLPSWRGFKQAWDYVGKTRLAVILTTQLRGGYTSFQVTWKCAIGSHCSSTSLVYQTRHSGSYGEESIYWLQSTGRATENVACATGIGIALPMLSAITTDRAPAMTGRNNALCMKDESFPNFVYYHCIIHQETVCINVLPFGYLMDIILVINSVTLAPFKRRLLFRPCWNMLNTDILILPCTRKNEGWVKVMLLPSFKPDWRDQGFSEVRKWELKQPRDSSWLVDLAAFTNVTDKLNNSNRKLQGRDKHVSQMIKLSLCLTN
jgi:hypothetical protein